MSSIAASILAIVSLCALLTCSALAETPGGAMNDYVRVSKRNPKYLELSSGKSFVPIGLNMITPPWDAPTDEGRIKAMDVWLTSLASNGGNYIRLWLSNDFFDVEHEKSGVFDEKKEKLIEQVLELCRKHSIRAKLTLEHFRSIGGGNQPWADKPLHNVANGGTAVSMTDWLANEPSREDYRNKIKWFAQKIGSRPEIYGWELWNEVNAVKDGDYMSWTAAMLPELHKAFPKNMAMQSLGSFDGDYARADYRKHSLMAANDIAQVHRYLDLGARFEVCHGPVDVLAADAVRELLAFNPGKPVIMAESGAVEPNHAGPFKLYEKDTSGTLLHDVLFAPFFAGAAGGGQIWHWDSYVAKNNLWWQYGRFAEAIKGFDPIVESPVPSMVDHPRLRIYRLTGKHTTLLWLRDKQNNWMTELRDGQAPETLHGLTMEVSGKTVRAYDPWKNQWTTLPASQGKITLPDFSRSLVLQVKN